MKKKYMTPQIDCVTIQIERVMNGGSINDYNGKTAGSLGSDTTTGGLEKSDGYVYGEGKRHDAWSSWEE